MAAEKRTPVCKVSVGGSPMETADQAMLVRASVDLDSELMAQTTLLFLDPQMKLINGNTFESGKAVELKMGYDAKAQSVFSGEVVRLEPQFRRDEPVALKVICQDSLHRLALSPMTRAFNDADVSSVVTSIAQEHGLSADAPSGTKQHIMQNNVTDAEFLNRFAKRMGLQLKLDGTKLTVGSPPSTTAIPLTLGDGVKKLKVKRKSSSQVSEVNVHGYDPKTKQEIVGKGKPKGDSGKGATDFGKGTLSDSSGDLLPPDQATADKIAQGRMDKIAEGFATLEADLIGDCRYTPGQIVELDKLGPGTDGNYRIEHANHLFNKHGYYVKFDAVWTGPKTPPAPPKPAEQPYKPPKPEDKGKLVRPRWKRRSGTTGKDKADLSVDAPGKALDGKGVSFILETKITGEWKQVAKADGTVSKGFANATADLDSIAAADVISEPKWTAAKDSKHQDGQKGEVAITSKVQKPHDLRVILEQQLIGGRVWEKIDETVVKVSGGKATAMFDLAHPHTDEAGKDDSDILKAPVWDQKPKGKEGPGLLSVAAPGLTDGRKVRFTVERLGRDGKWAAIKTVEAPVKNAAASTMLDLRHTNEKPQPKDSKVLSAPKWENADLAHGDMGKLTVDAPNMDGQRVRLIVERNDGGKWTPIGERTVKVAGGKATTEMPLKHPNANVKIPGSGPAKKGKLTKPTWSIPSAKHGDQVQVSVNAAGLDGSDVEFVIERLDGKSWVPAGNSSARVVSGKATAQVTLTHSSAATGASTAKDLQANRLRFRARLVSSEADADKLKVKLDPKTGMASVAIAGMEGRKISFVTEKNTAKGWTQVGIASATVTKGVASAKVSAPTKEGKLAQATWSARSASHGEQVQVSVDAKGLDGSAVEFALERFDGKTWVAAGISKTKVKGGKATAQMALKHPNAKGEGGMKLGDAKHDPKTGAATVAAAGLDGRKISFITEKKTAKGWVQLGIASAVVKAGAASAKVSAPRKEGKLAKPTWSVRSASHGDQVQVSVDAQGLDGSEVEFALERLDGKTWVAAGTSKARVTGGKATAKVTMAHAGAAKNAPTAADLRASRLRFRARVLGGEPIRVRAELAPDLDPKKLRFRARLLDADPIRVRAELAPDIDPKKLRFRAEAVPDVGAQKLRFRAEPIPDLRPRKLRFRAEVPVPENPALTRLRVELKGGTPDDSVQTGGSAD